MVLPLGKRNSEIGSDKEDKQLMLSEAPLKRIMQLTSWIPDVGDPSFERVEEEGEFGQTKLVALKVISGDKQGTKIPFSDDELKKLQKKGYITSQTPYKIKPRAFDEHLAQRLKDYADLKERLLGDLFQIQCNNPDSYQFLKFSVDKFLARYFYDNKLIPTCHHLIGYLINLQLVELGPTGKIDQGDFYITAKGIKELDALSKAKEQRWWHRTRAREKSNELLLITVIGAFLAAVFAPVITYWFVGPSLQATVEASVHPPVKGEGIILELEGSSQEGIPSISDALRWEISVTNQGRVACESAITRVEFFQPVFSAQAEFRYQESKLTEQTRQIFYFKVPTDSLLPGESFSIRAIVDTKDTSLFTKKGLSPGKAGSSNKVSSLLVPDTSVFLLNTTQAPRVTIFCRNHGATSSTGEVSKIKKGDWQRPKEKGLKD